MKDSEKPVFRPVEVAAKASSEVTKAAYAASARAGALSTSPAKATAAVPKPTPAQRISEAYSAPPTLEQAAARLNIAGGVLENLRKQGVATLADLRRTALSSNESELKPLRALADLTRLAPDLNVAGGMLDKGYQSIPQIADTPRSLFSGAMRDWMEPDAAARLHIAAVAESSLLKNIAVDLLVDPASGAALGNGTAGTAAIELPTPCECEDCQSAPSPAAYLADLIEYALKNLLSEGKQITIYFLDKVFCQPFSALPTDCAAVDKRVRQVRICAEVLREYLRQTPPAGAQLAQLKAAVSKYCMALYTTALDRLGVSYDEIRLARTLEPAARSTLAGRLGFHIDGAPRPDHLDALLLTGPDVNETNIERLFGVADTTRNPLSDGLTNGDTKNQVIRWNLSGVAWGRNTDADGAVYVSLAKVAATFEVTLFRDSARTQPVASGGSTNPVALVTVAEQNASGLSGTVEIGYLSDTGTISLQAIPRETAWQAEGLRPQWRIADRPADAYSGGDIPLIDPDLTGPDDFRKPAAKTLSTDPDLAFDIWLRRRDWVDTRLNALAALSNVPAMLNSLYASVVYQAVTATPWAASTPVSQFDALRDALEQGPTAAAAAATVRTDLRLPADKFLRIMDLRRKDQAAAVDPRNPPLSAAEWRELRSLLVVPQSSAFAAAWVAEENAAGTILGGEEFWPSLREPRPGDWPPAAAAPLIDPDLVQTTDLPEATAGIRALQFWTARQAQVVGLRAQIQAERESSGFDPMMRLALGDPNSGNPLPANTDSLFVDLSSTNPTTVAAAQAKIPSAFFMAVEQFVRLASIRKRDADPDPRKRPTAAEYSVVYDLLTGASKRKRLYPQWIAEEANSVSGVTYWRALKAALPPGRASRDQRAAWVAALANRCGAPVIDPDLIGPADLQNPSPGNAAFDLWSLRSSSVQTQWTAFKATRAGAATPLVGIDAIILSALGAQGTDLASIDEARAAGDEITARTAQLGLSPAAFSALLRVRQMAAAGAAILDSEWSDVYSILTQAVKVRGFAVWRGEEAAAHITQSPDWFVIPAADLAIPAWRGSLVGRLDWQSLLRSRINQQNSIAAATWQAADSAEEATITQLRDALIMGTDAPASDLPSAADWVSERFMIDAKEGACHKTTRTEQAIETLQTLMLAARSGQGSHAFVDATAVNGIPVVTDVDRTASTRDLFVVASDGSIYTNRRDPATNGGLWTGWYLAGGSLHVPPASAVTPVARDGDHIDIFVLGYDGGVYTNSWDTSSKEWQQWRAVGNPAAGDVAPAGSVVSALARDAGHLDIFVRRGDGRVYWNEWDAVAGKWHGWTALGADTFPGPVRIGAVTRSAAVMDIFAVGNDIDGKGNGAVFTNRFTAAWSGWKAVGNPSAGDTFPIRSAVTAVSQDASSMDIFVTGREAGKGNGGIFTNRWTSVWGSWSAVGNPAGGDAVPLRSVISAVTRGSGAMDIFAVAADGGILANRWTGTWRKWYPVASAAWGEGVLPGTVVAAVAGSTRHIDLYVVSAAGIIRTDSWDILNSTNPKFIIWSGWTDVGSANLTLDAPDFDEEWKWLGSYATWRAAILVYLHPQDILHPALRRWQTPGFRRAVYGVRAAPRLTVELACTIACDYSKYFHDVCTMRIEASCVALVQIHKQTGCACGAAVGEREQWYLMGRGGATNRVYWRTYYERDATDQSYWDFVPGLAGQNVINLIGAAAYSTPTGRNFVCLFARVQNPGMQALVLTRYDLNNQVWDSDCRALSLPETSTDFDAVLQPKANDSDPPRLRIRQASLDVYERELNREATDWVPGKWAAIVQPWAAWFSISGPVPSGIETGRQITAVARRPDQLDLFLIGNDGAVYSTFWNAANAEPGGWHASWFAISPTGTVDAPWTSTVSAVAHDPDHLDVFVVANTGGEHGDPRPVLWTRWGSDLNGGAWPSGPWQQIHPETQVDGTQWISAISRFPHNIDLFLCDTSNRVLRSNWNGTTWTPWGVVSNSGGCHYVSAISRRPSHIDLFSASDAGWMLTTWADANTAGGSWNPWGTIGIANAPDTPKVSQWTPPSAVARTPTHMDIFTLGQAPNDKKVYSVWWDVNVNAAQWEPWFQLDGVEAWSYPAAVARDANHLDVFLINMSGQVLGKNWTANHDPGWGPWKPVGSGWFPGPAGAGTTGGIVALSRMPNHFDVFVIRNDNRIYTTWWHDVDWASASAPALPGVQLFPTGSGPFDLPERLSTDDIQGRRVAIQQMYQINAAAPPDVRLYLDEAYYFVQMLLALALQQVGENQAALDRYRIVYDYTVPAAQRKIYYGLVLEESLPAVTSRAADWLLDPLNPHLIAASRRNAYTRYTILCIARCLAEEADAAFAHDTSESDAYARVLYGIELALLQDPVFLQAQSPCEGLLIEPDTLPGVDAGWKPMIADLNTMLKSLGDRNAMAAASKAVSKALTSNRPEPVRFVEARTEIAKARASLPSKPHMDEVLERKKQFLSRVTASLLSDSNISAAADKAHQDIPAFAVVVGPSFWFCTPTDSVVTALRTHAEISLYKLRNCMNIAGMLRELDPYSAPTDAMSGMPQVTAGGVLASGVTAMQPTPYPYAMLIERAKQLAQLAAQMETAMLAAIEKTDAENYNRLKAGQDVRLAAATVDLQDLRIAQAQDGVKLAQLQTDRARFQSQHWDSLLSAGVNDNERTALNLFGTSAAFQFAAATAYTVAAATPSAQSAVSFGSSNETALASAFSSLAGASGTLATVYSTMASQERRAEDWAFQRDTANQDIQIGEQQTVIARDQVQVATQDRAIAAMTAANDQAIVDFLANKFTNAELYEWMSGVLQRVYAFFLQRATVTAKLAENQVAFQRQQPPTSFIQSDYWTEPTTSGNTASAPDRRGLTGSARLLQDIFQLDEYALETDQRKLQLTKTLSLMQADPFAFARFQETGVMRFATPMELFDRDFPGHYLRLIKRVRVSVIALIPPGQGIRATLSTTAASRVVTGRDTFQSAIVRRDPQSVALTSPLNASGLFDLDAQPAMLLPFEGLGVDAQWELRMAKASNPIDYTSMADILFNLEYTALDSYDYRQVVLRGLGRELISDRAYSFRYEFADAWYDLHNPDQSATPMSVRFSTTAADFAPNLEDVRIRQVVLYFARADGESFEVAVSALRFTPKGASGASGGAAQSFDGIISTRRGNAASWIPILGKTPEGDWELTLPDTAQTRVWFSNDRALDILLVITYAGRTSNWPE